MRKRIKSSMLKFARELGAMRGKRPDWYLVAEHLAEIARPDLLDSPSTGPGRKGNNWFFLVTDVNLVQRQKDCSVEDACGWLVEGYLPHHVTATLPDGTQVKGRAASEKWKGREPENMRQRYYQCLREWRKRYPAPEDDAEAK